MKLQFLDIDVNKGKPKATIHFTGKLGFNMEAIEFMKLGNKTAYKLAKDEEKAGVFYLVEADEEKGAAKVAKAGTYYYLNVGDAFDTLGYDFKGHSITFTITKGSYDDKDLFIFTKSRESRRKDNKAE